MSILRIANLCKTYYITNTERQDVLKGVNLELDKGELVALLGESGCGKSTLLNILGGLDEDYTGSVVIRGKFIRDFSEKEMDDYRKKQIGLIFQNYNLISHMSLVENVEIAMKMSDIDKEVMHKRALDLLDMVGLKAHANKNPNQLSGGQKQRVAIARALANNPSIILADEPTGALDKEASEQVHEILKKIAQMGKLVIVVTHSSEVADICTRVVRLEDGVVKSDEVRQKPFKDKYEKYKEVAPRSIKTKDVAKLSFRNILATKGRSFLVSIGISIGIAALILILCLSNGITNYVKDYYGADGISTVIKVDNSGSSISSSKISSVSEIDGVEDITKSTYLKSVSATYSANSETYTMAAVYEAISANSQTLLYGHTPSTGEIIIDLDYAESLSSDQAIATIGNSLTLTYSGVSQSFKIVGIYDDSSTTSGYISQTDMDTFSTVVSTLYVTVTDVTYLDAVCDGIASLSLNATQMNSEASTVLDYIDLGTTVLTAVALIAMVVSAIMIIIVMYISVIERTQEIGILRSIGARKKDILKMFLSESSMLGTLGGTLGVVIALVIGSITNIVSNISAGYMFISYNPVYYILGLLVSIVVSILAGIAPSNKAANLDPIEALRYE